MAELPECPALGSGSGRDVRVMRLSPEWDSALTVESGLDYLSLSLCSPSCPTLHLHSPADSKISWLLCHGSPAGSPCLSLHLKQNHSISALGFCLSSLCICFRPLSKAPCLSLPLVPAWHAHPKPQKPAPSGHSDSMTNIPASVASVPSK